MKSTFFIAAISLLTSLPMFAGETVKVCESYGARLEINEVVSETGRVSAQAVVSGAAASYIVDQEGEDVWVRVTGYGNDYEGQKELPASLQIDENRWGQFVTVNNMFFNDRGGLDSGQYRPSLRAEAGGLKFSVPFFDMTGSHTTIFYMYAEWFFPDCSL